MPPCEATAFRLVDRHAFEHRLLQNRPRFPEKLLVAKWVSLLQDYAALCLTQGVEVAIPQTITAHMIKGFETEFNLTLRKPNRRYKVSKSVLAERLEIFWTNLFRVRKLVLLVFGYDPAMQNFDQSAFHRNESGKSASSLN